MPFPYPLTVICGRNGVGKSTVLGLTALSSRPPDNWRVHWGNSRPRRTPNARKRYTFSDFFHRPRGSVSPDGLRLTYVVMNAGNEIEVTEEMREGRWVRVTDPGRPRRAGDRPAREIDFVPMGRVLSAGEIGALRAAFQGGGVEQIEDLNAASIAQLSYVMGRQYDQAETQFIRGLGLSRCNSGGAYTGFDMGGGESSVIALLSRIQRMPRGGLLIVEEVELGLHCEAQERLVEVLIQACWQKKLQVVCTSHSEVIIDAVPRQARVLLRKAGDGHEALTNVSTRFAVHDMAGRAQPELLVYTEDTLAGMIVEECLTSGQRARLSIRDVGSNVTLARQSVAHLRMQPALKSLSAFDGDCTEAQITGWLNDEAAERDLHPDWVILPGDGLPPERWLVTELAGQAYRNALAQELNCDAPAATAHVEALQVQLDHHDCGHVLSERTGLPHEAAQRLIVRSVARTHPALEPLRAKVAQRLDAPIG